MLDLRISHRFGDIATPSSGRTLFGLDNSTDIRIGFEYGISDQIMLGFGRSKGAGPYLEVWDGLIKYKILSQSEKFPLSLSVVSSAFVTSMLASTDSTELTSFKSSFCLRSCTWSLPKTFLLRTTSEPIRDSMFSGDIYEAQFDVFVLALFI